MFIIWNNHVEWEHCVAYNSYFLCLAHTCTFIYNYFKDVSSVQEFAVAVCHPGYVLEGEVCVCNDSHPDIYRCDGSSRYVYIRVGQQQQ